MRVHKLSLSLVALLVAMALMVPLSASATPGVINTAVQGTTNIPGNSFVGNLSITGFNLVNGVINATGTLTGNVLNSAGNVVGSIGSVPVSIPLTSLNGTCPILNLTLGPLDLNLLGLKIHLNQVVLNITAQSGPGNLLGNLLCDIAHLLDSGGTLQAIVNDLNQILTQL
jgi:hypothetical protein